MTKFLQSESRALIYLVDDDPSFAMSLSHALRIEGYDVRPFLDVLAFLESDLDTDAIVISDMRMPKMTGLDLQDALKERGVNLPVIFVSGESTVGQAISAMKGGALDFLLKPFQPEDLFRRIEEIVSARAQSVTETEAARLLSPREYVAFQYFVKGFGNPYVAKKMGIQVSTVKEFKTNIFRKLGVANLSEMIERYKS